jgi:hypothetical protein
MFVFAAKSIDPKIGQSPQDCACGPDVILANTTILPRSGGSRISIPALCAQTGLVLSGRLGISSP